MIVAKKKRGFLQQVTDDLRLAYDREAQDRNKKAEPPWKKTERQNFLQLLKQEGKSSLLEIGARPGWDSLFFQQNNLALSAPDLAKNSRQSPIRIMRARNLL